MHDQVKIIELRARRLKEVSRKTSRGVVENSRKLYECYGCRIIKPSGRAAAQNYLPGWFLRFPFLGEGAGANPPSPPARKMEGLPTCHATDLRHLRTQTKTRRASQAWRDIRPRAVTAGWSPSQVPEPLSMPAASFPTCALSVRGTRKPPAAYPDRAGDSPPRPRTRGRSGRAAPRLQRWLAYLPAGCRCPNRNGDTCAPGTSRHSASTCRCR